MINYLASDPSQIEAGLELKGKEYDTKSVGRIDLLCIDKNRDFVVVETKKGKESDKVVGQIQRYMGWITRNLAKNGGSVRGIIIVNECDEWLDYAVSVNDNIQLKYYEVKWSIVVVVSGKNSKKCYVFGRPLTSKINLECIDRPGGKKNWKVHWWGMLVKTRRG